MSQKAGLILPLALLLGGLSCTAPQPAPDIKDPEAAIKIAGIRQAAARKDRSVLPALVAALDSDDPAVRLFAIEALQRFAGERFGYEYYYDEELRKPSLARWQAWLKQQTDVQKPDGK
jgi:HEAT repeats